ncbi:MAG: PepSY domain-containing protein [Verrucomicrobia bacterium]|nr:PepSY domain-containing protein [Verrucomicrobiota bacterium]
MNKTPGPAPRSKNWLLTKFRNWHIQAGIVVGSFLLLVGATGIFLNHKPFFLRAVGLEPKREMTQRRVTQAQNAPAQELRLGSALTAHPVSFDKAVSLARERWGDLNVEKIELRDEAGELLYRIKQKEGPELLISATTGDITERGNYEKLGKPGPDGKPACSFDWGKLALDLHTGKIVGAAGRVAMSSVSFVMLSLSLTGLYLWAVPKWRKRQSAKQARTKAAASPVARPTTVPVLPVVHGGVESRHSYS